MKLTVNLGEEFKNVKVTYPDKLLIYNWDHKVIGEAFPFKEGEEIKADIHIINEKDVEQIKDILELGCAGTVTEIDNNIIKGFNLTSVSIQWKEDRKVYPKK